MNEFLNEALAKIDKGMKERLDRYGEVMKADVGAALKDFCKQDAEFAQAVAQGGSFADCMKAVAKGVKGSAISDMKAFGLAVGFYFPGADIDVTMRVNLCASVEDDDPSVGSADSSMRPRCGIDPYDTREPLRSKGPVIDLTAFF